MPVAFLCYCDDLGRSAKIVSQVHKNGKDSHEVSTHLEVSLWLVRLEAIGLINILEGTRERKVLFGKNNGEGISPNWKHPLNLLHRLLHEGSFSQVKYLAAQKARLNPSCCGLLSSENTVIQGERRCGFRRHGKLLVYLVLFCFEPLVKIFIFCIYFMTHLICAIPAKIKAAKSHTCILNRAGHEIPPLDCRLLAR